METMRLTLIFLHTFIAIFSVVNLHPQLALVANALDRQKQISAIVGCVSELVRISLYHIASIIAVWFSLRYGAGLVRASGILLVGELFQVITTVLQHALGSDHIGNGELGFIVIYDLLLVLALLITFRLAEKVSKREKNLLQVELLAKTMNILRTHNYIESDVL